MKILFICDWDYVYLWHPVAKQLKERGIADKCIALVVGRIYFEKLSAENEGVFDRIYLLQDGVEHVPDSMPDVEKKLLALESKYHEHPLWRYVWADRSWVKCGHEEINKRLVVCFDYFEELYGREKPDLVLTNAYASMPHLISYEIAKKLGIPAVRPMSIRLEDRYILSDNAMEEEDWIGDYFTAMKSISDTTRSEVNSFLSEFRQHNKKPAYQTLRAKEHEVSFGHLYRFLRYMYRYWVSGTFKGDHSKPTPLRRLINESTWRIRRAISARPSQWDSFKPEEKYVYFPLHVQPEMSTMTFAPFYLDQLSILENLSKSLPTGYRLLVKEHPSMLGRRKGSYYERIRSLPNAILVSPFVDSFKITNNAEMIFTITGTVGLEGLIMKKPVIVLGSTFYRFCPLTISAMDVAPTQWPRLIADTLAVYQHDEEVLITFLGALFERAFCGIYVEPLAALDKVLALDNLDTLINQILHFTKGNIAASGGQENIPSPPLSQPTE